MDREGVINFETNWIFFYIGYLVKMKLKLLPPLFKLFNKSTFFSSLNQNTCPVLDVEEIKKQEQKEAIDKLFPGNYNWNFLVQI